MRITQLTIIFCFLNNILLAQLSIGEGTKWVSDNGTIVTLDALGLRYNSSPVTFQNVFQFTGANDVNVNSSADTKFTNLVVDKASNKIALNSDLYITNAVRFKSGLFNLNNHQLTMGSSALIKNESETSRFMDTGNGFITISVSLASPSAVNAGNLGVGITSAYYNGSATIWRGHNPLMITGSSSNSINRYYVIETEDKGGINATLRLHYFDSETNGQDENKFTIWRNHLDTWSNAGLSAASTTSNYVEQVGFNAFGTFTISDNGESAVTAVSPDYNKQFVISVYPTVAVGDRIYIETGKADVDKMQVQVLDMAGRQLSNESLTYTSQWITLPSSGTGMNIIRIQAGKLQYRCLFMR